MYTAVYYMGTGKNEEALLLQKLYNQEPTLSGGMILTVHEFGRKGTLHTENRACTERKISESESSSQLAPIRIPSVLSHSSLRDMNTNYSIFSRIFSYVIETFI